MKTFAKTLTASSLSKDGDKLRLVHPSAALSVCQGHVPPYEMPDGKGFLILAEYGDPKSQCKPGCVSVLQGCGCGGVKCGDKRCQKSPKCDKPGDMSGDLLRYEVIETSGYDTDGVTLLIQKRSVEGYVDQEWPAGTLVFQGATGSELAAINERFECIESWLRSMGAIASIPAARLYLEYKTGQWVADPTGVCWRRAKKDGVILNDDFNRLKFPKPGEGATDTWSACFDIQALLEVVHSLPKPADILTKSRFNAFINSLPKPADILTKDDQQELVYYFGNDQGSAVVDDYTFNLQQNDVLFGPAERIPGGIRLKEDQLLDISFEVSAGYAPGGSAPSTVVAVHIDGEYRGTITKVAGISLSLDDNVSTAQEADDYKARGGLNEFPKGTEIVLKTVEGRGFGRHKKGGATLKIIGLPKYGLKRVV